MGDWQELGQAVFIGLVFAFLVAKLISTVLSFRDENLKVVRHEDLPEGEGEEEATTPAAGTAASTAEAPAASSSDKKLAGKLQETGSEGLVGGRDDDKEEEDEDDDDWEGIESTELDEMFSAATAFVAASAADRMGPKVSSEMQLQLYGFYKIATEGPCTAPQPSALKMTARAKWNAWQKLGAMPPEEAMQKYIVIVTELYPSWATGSTSASSQAEGSDKPASAKGPVGPVFSSFVHEEDPNNESKLDAIHDSAREGEVEVLLTALDSGVPVNLKDSEGRTPLHWAVDRGHVNVVEMLISRTADVNAKDNEGQTPLHYAVLCEREAIADLLVRHGADPDSKDSDGKSSRELCGSPWGFMSPK